MTIQSVRRAMAVLRSFSEIRPELGVTELAAIHQVHKSTISRLLATLESEGMVTQNQENGHYRLGIGLVGLAGVALGQISVRGAAQPSMARMVHDLQETTILWVRDGREAVTVEWLASTQALRYVGWIGRRVPLYCTASGRILMAWLPQDQQSNLLPFMPKAYTSSTVLDPLRLQQILREVRMRGWSLVVDEFEEGFGSLSAPIWNHLNQVAAALEVAIPTARLNDDNLPLIRGTLLTTAQKISASLGFQL